jgi:hypothetical protein
MFMAFSDKKGKVGGKIRTLSHKEEPIYRLKGEDNG